MSRRILDGLRAPAMRPLAAVCIAFAPGLAFGGGGSYLDLYYVPQAKIELSVPGFADDQGDGYGVKAWMPSGAAGALTAEYQSNKYEDAGEKTDQLRVGLGMATGDTRSGLYAEYIKLDSDGEKADGFAIQGRLEGNPAAANLFAQVGYLMLEDDAEKLKGVEYLIGIAFPFNRATGGFVDYRRTTLTGADSDIETRWTDVRAGVRMNF